MFTAPPTPSYLGSQAHVAQQGRGPGVSNGVALLVPATSRPSLANTSKKNVSLCTRPTVSCGPQCLTVQNSILSL